MENDYYEERQKFAAWVYWLMGLSMAAAVAGIAVSLLLNGLDKLDQGDIIATVVAVPTVGIGLLLSLNILMMTTRITDREVIVVFGMFFPMFWRRISLYDIRESRSVQYHPLRDAGGWGIHWGRFDGARCTFYNVRSDLGVFIETDTKRYLIGSQTPDAFQAALDKARADARRHS